MSADGNGGALRASRRGALWLARGATIALPFWVASVAIRKAVGTEVTPTRICEVAALGVVLFALLGAVGFLIIRLIRRRTEALTRRLGVDSLMVMADPWAGLRQLVHADSRYAIPPFISVVSSDDALEFWGGPHEAAPFAVVPRNCVTRARIALVPTILPRSAIALSIAGVTDPVYLIVYARSLWSWLPDRGRRLQRLAQELRIPLELRDSHQ